jgi:hypothetical protein
MSRSGLDLTSLPPTGNGGYQGGLGHMLYAHQSLFFRAEGRSPSGLKPHRSAALRPWIAGAWGSSSVLQWTRLPRMALRGRSSPAAGTSWRTERPHHGQGCASTTKLHGMPPLAAVVAADAHQRRVRVAGSQRSLMLRAPVLEHSESSCYRGAGTTTPAAGVLGYPCSIPAVHLNGPTEPFDSTSAAPRRLADRTGGRHVRHTGLRRSGKPGQRDWRNGRLRDRRQRPRRVRRLSRHDAHQSALRPDR